MAGLGRRGGKVPEAQGGNLARAGLEARVQASLEKLRGQPLLSMGWSMKLKRTFREEAANTGNHGNWVG